MPVLLQHSRNRNDSDPNIVTGQPPLHRLRSQMRVVSLLLVLVCQRGVLRRRSICTRASGSGARHQRVSRHLVRAIRSCAAAVPGQPLHDPYAVRLRPGWQGDWCVSSCGDDLATYVCACVYVCIAQACPRPFTRPSTVETRCQTCRGSHADTHLPTASGSMTMETVTLPMVCAARTTSAPVVHAVRASVL